MFGFSAIPSWDGRKAEKPNTLPYITTALQYNCNMKYIIRQVIQQLIVSSFQCKHSTNRTKQAA